MFWCILCIHLRHLKLSWPQLQKKKNPYHAAFLSFYCVLWFLCQMSDIQDCSACFSHVHKSWSKQYNLWNGCTDGSICYRTVDVGPCCWCIKLCQSASGTSVTSPVFGCFWIVQSYGQLTFTTGWFHLWITNYFCLLYNIYHMLKAPQAINMLQIWPRHRVFAIKRHSS